MSTTAMYARIVVGLTLTAIQPAGLLGQASLAPAQSTIQTHLNMMKASSRLRLHADSKRQEGQLFFRNADSLGIRGADGDRHLALRAVDSLWVRKHHTWEGLLIGTLVGLGGYVVTTSAITNEDSDMDGLDNLFGGAIWAGSALLGTIVGALVPGWKRVYP